MKENWRDYIQRGIAAFLTVAACIVFYFFMERFQGVQGYVRSIYSILRPFLYGAVIAYLLTPVCNCLERNIRELFKQHEKEYGKFISTVSVFLSLSFFILIIYGILSMLIPQLISSVLLLVDALPGYIERCAAWMEKLVEDNPVMVNYVEMYSEDIIESAENFAKTNLLPNINNIISGVSTSVFTIVLAAKDLIIGLIVAIYMMSSRKTFCRQGKDLICAIFPHPDNLMKDEKSARSYQLGVNYKKTKANWIIREVGIMNDYMGGFIKGKLLDSLIIGLICLVFTSVVEMPYAVLVSVVIGVTNIIPFFGPFIGAIPSALLILMVNPMKCVVFVVFILILQQIDGNIIGPKILGNVTNLSTFWTLFSILFFGGMFGIPGMVLGVPVFGFIYQLVREWVNDRREMFAQPVQTEEKESEK